ncbi:recombinase family protein [Cucumibacter marinus]|uniref:recombinase family protein n=1 Tax=Cucumibacter marinus TaxID=1121252 RepID=UPI00040350C4|nr:recombinase family protein [Cucumibacter marinus]
MSTRQKIRCAIYTRKSSEEGLDQDFNSLDAQYEASAAYVASQKHEGWKLVRDRYDDGGISGGTLERPGLERLMADIDAGLIDMVVVYKIDRLTRSLADFAKLVERFETAGCSFVSVTQAFNTSSSMGRLTLNVLLSFAQFEREVTAERIRDKIAASKKKGMWMGGTIPLGYDRHPDPQMRQLVINENEATTVRRLFTLYDALGCLNLTMQQANSEGLRSKLHIHATGKIRGGKPFSRGQLYYLLRNPTYIGRIPHKAESHVGLHAPIIDQDLWDRVQLKLETGATRPRRNPSANAKSPSETSPLAGKLFDESGDRLTPSHATRKGKRHRYYVSNRLIQSRRTPDDQTGWRLPAAQLEHQIADHVLAHVEQRILSHRLLIKPDTATSAILNRSIKALSDLSSDQKIVLASRLISRCEFAPGTMVIALNQDEVGHQLKIDPHLIVPETLSITTPFQLKRRGIEAKIVSGTTPTLPDKKLIDLLARAHHWLDQIKAGKPMHEISAQEGRGQDYVRSRIELAFLSPPLQQQILEGTQPPHLTLDHFIKGKVPISWQEQQDLYGHPDPSTR